MKSTIEKKNRKHLPFHHIGGNPASWGIMICLLCACALFFTPSPVTFTPLYAAEEEAPFPRPQGFVTDQAGLLSPQSSQHLTGLITFIKQKTGAEVAVVTIDSISPYSIEEYAVTLFEAWGIGEKGKDNGILLLVAVKERRVKIEVGYGLEGAVTDGTAGEIIRQLITPPFKKGDFDQGLVAGTEGILHLIAKEYGVELPEGVSFKTDTALKEERDSWAGGIFSLFVLLFIVMILFKGRLWPLLFLGFPGGGNWSGGRGGFGGMSGGGGFGGFGGGMSGGGGASGSW